MFNARPEEPRERESEKKTFEKAGSNLDLEGTERSLWSILPTL